MNSFNDADTMLLNKHRHVQTAIGVVVKMPFSEPIPPGWRRVTIQEGR